jgi:hypothetical protein
MARANKILILPVPLSSRSGGPVVRRCLARYAVVAPVMTMACAVTRARTVALAWLVTLASFMVSTA